MCKPSRLNIGDIPISWFTRKIGMTLLFQQTRRGLSKCRKIQVAHPCTPLFPPGTVVTMHGNTPTPYQVGITSSHQWASLFIPNFAKSGFFCAILRSSR